MIIKKLPSGFYGVWSWNSTEGHAPLRADLIPWDGKRGTSCEYNAAGDSNYCDYYIDAENNVYYSVHRGDTGYWCSGKRLSAHCHHLAQIAARR